MMQKEFKLNEHFVDSLKTVTDNKYIGIGLLTCNPIYIQLHLYMAYNHVLYSS